MTRGSPGHLHSRVTNSAAALGAGKLPDPLQPPHEAAASFPLRDFTRQFIPRSNARVLWAWIDSNCSRIQSRSSRAPWRRRICPTSARSLRRKNIILKTASVSASQMTIGRSPRDQDDCFRRASRGAPLEELDGRLRPRIRLLRRKAGGQSTAIDFGSRAAGADDHFTALPVRERGHSILVEFDLPRRGRQSAPQYARRPWAVPLPVSCLIGSSRLASQSLRSSGRATQPAKAGTPTHVSASSRTLNSSFQRPSVLALTHQSSSMPNSVTFEWKWTGA